jgi:hypothetical protein
MGIQKYRAGAHRTNFLQVWLSAVALACAVVNSQHDVCQAAS